MKEKRYEIFNGSKTTMGNYASGGVKGLNGKTKRWQIIDKSAKYFIVPVFDGISNNEKYCCLYCDKNLYKIARDKNLIL